MINETIEKYLIKEYGTMKVKKQGNDYIVLSADSGASRAHSMFKKGEKIPTEMFMHMIDRYNIDAQFS